MIIALDGPAASGKGEIGRRLAERFGFAHLDTGLLYRAVALRLMDAEGGARDRTQAGRIASGVAIASLSQEDEVARLRDPEVGEFASRVAAWPEVRKAVLACQRRFAAHPPGEARGAILDGRDIASVVCPNADLKVFVTADLRTRAARRARELAARGLPSSLSEVLAAIRERDKRDRNRELAPLRKAPDAFLLDTTKLDIDTAVERVAARIAERSQAGAGTANRSRD